MAGALGDFGERSVCQGVSPPTGGGALDRMGKKSCSDLQMGIGSGGGLDQPGVCAVAADHSPRAPGTWNYTIAQPARTAMPSPPMTRGQSRSQTLAMLADPRQTAEELDDEAHSNLAAAPVGCCWTMPIR
jgi:hypothetical protein